jgi:hypothetical protein
VTLFGLGQSRAVYRGEGLGCYLDHGGAVADISVPAPDAKVALLPDIAGPSIVAPQTPQLAAAPSLPSVMPTVSASIRRCSDSPPPNR